MFVGRKAAVLWLACPVDELVDCLECELGGLKLLEFDQDGDEFGEGVLVGWRHWALGVVVREAGYGGEYGIVVGLRVGYEVEREYGVDQDGELGLPGCNLAVAVDGVDGGEEDGGIASECGECGLGCGEGMWEVYSSDSRVDDVLCPLEHGAVFGGCGVGRENC